MRTDFNKTFLVCPNCGNPNRFMEQLGQELKDKGWASEEVRTCLTSNQGTFLDKTRVNLIPIGSTVPGFLIETDICMNCGTVYAVKLVRTEGKFMGIQPERKTLPTPPRY